MGTHTDTVSRKNAMVINIARSYAQSRVSIGFSCTVSKIQNTGHSQRNSPWEVVRARFRKKTRRSYTLREVARRVVFRSVFRVPSWNFKILDIPDILAHVEFRLVVRVPSRKFKIFAIPDVLAHGKSYEHGFEKKRDGHKLWEWPFPTVVRVPSRKFKILAIPNVLAHGKSYEHGFMKMQWSQTFHKVARRVEFRSVFHAPSRKFKILAIPDLLAHWKSYEHGFTRKPDGHKHYAKSRVESSFDRFFVHRLGNLKYWPFPTYLTMGSHTNTVSRKNAMVIHFRDVPSRVEFRSIFRAPSRKFKILANPNVIAHGKSYEHNFANNLDG
ncbi:hypothetical protein BHE74_00050070 [Ensete ventricosum]|nr:hypothetical protein BHE74_00050070 [Ensete ventricosum]